MPGLAVGAVPDLVTTGVVVSEIGAAGAQVGAVTGVVCTHTLAVCLHGAAA